MPLRPTQALQYGFGCAADCCHQRCSMLGAGVTARVQVRTQTFGHAGKNEAYRDQAKELAHVMTDVASVADGVVAADKALHVVDVHTALSSCSISSHACGVD